MTVQTSDPVSAAQSNSEGHMAGTDQGLSEKSGTVLRGHLAWEKKPLEELRLSAGGGHVVGGQPQRA